MSAEQTTDLAAIHGLGSALIQASSKIEEIVARCRPEHITALPPTLQTLVLAKGMHDLRQAMTKEVVDKLFMPLQGTKLGFRTDKDKDGGYPWEIVRDCVIEAMLRGFRPIGNELNIIGGNFYATQEAFDRKVTEFPGLTNLELRPGVPVLKDGGALVPYEASWLLDGKPDCISCNVTKTPEGEILDRRIPVRVNSGQGADAILGKAKRKVLARIYERISGVRIPEGDVVDTVGEAVETDKRAKGTDAAAADLVNKHKAKAGQQEREPGQEG